jgi:predicted HTH domain antitoxin
MRTLNLNIPDTIELSNQHLTLLLATKLYEQGLFSLGQAAELAGLSVRTFTEMLFLYSVSIFNYPPNDFAKEVENA